jgi:hypothetical protein
MTGDIITIYEDVTTNNMQELYTGVIEEDTLAKKKHVTNQVARSADMHMDVDT